MADITKESLAYVAGLKEESLQTITHDHEGKHYVKDFGSYSRVLPDEVSCMAVHGIDSLVKYIKDCLGNEKIKKPYIVKSDYDCISVSSGLDENKNRENIVMAKPQLPNIDFNHYLSMENFVIQLNTCFEQTENCLEMIKMVSKITDKAEITFQDNGIGMEVSQKSGIHIETTDKFTLNPIAVLHPYSTFMEVDQPERKFLLRVRDGGQMALFEADGGVWKSYAQKSVMDYLESSLADEIKNNDVVVLG